MFFSPKKDQNVRFPAKFQGKAHIIERQFSQNVRVFMLGTVCFLTGFWLKQEQNVRFQADFLAKPLVIERQIFQNVTILYDRYI